MRNVPADRRVKRLKTLERGHIYFFYRPKVDRPSARGLADIRRLYVVMHPRRRRIYRLIIIAEKRLPDVTGRGDRKSWGFVEKVGRRPEDVEDELDPETYVTRTRGERHLPAARPAGEGVYALVPHEGHTHLAHALRLPPRPGPVQRALHIVEEGSYIVSVKNPEAPSPAFVGLDETRRARFPQKLLKRFEGRRFIPVDTQEFLDYEGAEILLIGASRNVAKELGLQLTPERETKGEAAIFRDLRLEESPHPVTPLFKGTWA